MQQNALLPGLPGPDGLKCQIAIKKCQIASKNAKQAERGQWKPVSFELPG